jgi:hypothetical protein
MERQEASEADRADRHGTDGRLSCGDGAPDCSIEFSAEDDLQGRSAGGLLRVAPRWRLDRQGSQRHFVTHLLALRLKAIRRGSRPAPVGRLGFHRDNRAAGHISGRVQPSCALPPTRKVRLRDERVTAT